MLTIYGVYSSRAARPLWLLHELGLPFAHVPVVQDYRVSGVGPGGMQTTRSPEFLAVNPIGQIPAMADDGLVLTESMAITFYIARKAGGPLAPADPGEEALALNWAFLGMTAVEPPALEILFAAREQAADAAAVVARAVDSLSRPFARIEAHLTAQDWLMGGRFTVADLMLAECVRYTTGAPEALAPFPALKAWLERCHTREGFQAMWAARTAEKF